MCDLIKVFAYQFSSFLLLFFFNVFVVYFSEAESTFPLFSSFWVLFHFPLFFFFGYVLVLD
jgi:hypothetical protein